MRGVSIVSCSAFSDRWGWPSFQSSWLALHRGAEDSLGRMAHRLSNSPWRFILFLIEPCARAGHLLRNETREKRRREEEEVETSLV